MEKKLTKLDGAATDRMMTLKQALAFGKRCIRPDLKAHGFKAEVYTATNEVNGWDGYNITFGKRVAA